MEYEYGKRAESILSTSAMPLVPRDEVAQQRVLGSWSDDLLEIASQLLFGFSFNDGGGDLSAVLNGVQTSLGQIQQSLGTLAQQLGDIEHMLQQLPQVIAGILDAEFAKEWLNGARSDAGNIKDKMLDVATYGANAKAVDALTDSLGKSIGEVWAFSQNGAMAATLTCGLIGVWVQAKSTILMDPILNPSRPDIRTISFYIQMKQLFDVFLANLASARAQALSTTENTPHNTLGHWLFDATQGAFKETTAPIDETKQFYISPPKAPTQLWGLTTAGGPGDHLFRVIDSTTIPLGPWVDKQNVAAAYAAWPNSRQKLAEAGQALTYLTSFDQARAEIQQVLF